MEKTRRSRDTYLSDDEGIKLDLLEAHEEYIHEGYTASTRGGAREREAATGGRLDIAPIARSERACLDRERWNVQ